MRSLRQQLQKDSICGYAMIFQDVLPGCFLSGIDPTKRQRSFGHVPVFWAWLAQILEGNASCNKALSLIQAWHRVLGLAVPSGDTSAFCRARGRISDDFLLAVDERVRGTLARRVQPSGLWRGHLLKAIDGTSVTLMDTPANQASYPQHSSQKVGCGFPIMGIVGMVNLSHGGVEGFETCGFRKHDARVAPRLLKHCSPGEIVLGDRAFCSFEFISRIISERQGHVLMRLHQSRHRKLDWRKGRKVSPIERLVTWQRPSNPPPGSNLNQEQWERLPAEMTLRYIKLGYENRAGEKSALVIVTDLLDPDTYPAEDVADLYMERWQIEVKFRDLKTTMGMERFTVKTPAMAHKTLRMMVIAYNLLRLTMQKAARQSGRRVHELSVKGTLCTLTSSHETFRAVAGKPRLARKLNGQLIQTCAGHVLNIRPFRREPRATKRRPKTHQLLTCHRHVFREVHHRSTAYRKPSKAA